MSLVASVDWWQQLIFFIKMTQAELWSIGQRDRVEHTNRTSPAAYPVAGGVLSPFKNPERVALSADRGLAVLKITGGSPPMMTTAWCGALRGAGSPMITTTDGQSNPIVWILGAEGDNRLHGFREILENQSWASVTTARC
jgi:hypothetical protein